MARSFVPANTDKIETAASLLTYVGVVNCTVACLFNPSSNANLCMLADSSGGSNAAGVEMFTLGGTPAFWARMYPGGVQTTVTGGTVTVGGWNASVVTYDGSNVTLFGNGSQVDQGAATGDITDGGGGAFFTIGERGASNTFYWDGAIAEVAIWDIVLDASEIAALAKFYSPAFIRPSHLIRYWPLLRTANEIMAGDSGTYTGTTVSAHPRIIMPRGGQKTKRMRPIVSANIYVYMRPDGDSSDGSWLNELGNNTNLYASIDETTADDADYIISSTTLTDKVRLQLSDPGSGVAEPLAVRYRASATSGTITLTGRLYQGAGLITSWTQVVTTTLTDYSATVPSTDFATISDFNDLLIEFEYTS